ncbi:GNAT family N-acetyltransferase [Paenibacillus sp. P96]|uniref:GNAT family N-acetyltransferase n=1 Tax=Paenibacillus zeirhizosphaerae TaxID=2987519 RepID=A0ABT9FSB5_9BACL|nr:GNAT family N-acetyltransferase [Paenibacillus sp. P96]MDP4097627.1 GNAT family N-acetyltransferase [Paenibacillus sp. P96]
MHKYIEEFSLNALPALYQMSVDGWITRYAEGYTQRSNSVSPIYSGDEICIEEKILACERFYARAGLDPIFKITPFIQPANLDEVLEKRGYETADLSCVQTLSLDHIKGSHLEHVKVAAEISDEWMDVYARFTHLPAEYVTVKRKMLSLPVLNKAFIILYQAAEPVACVMGVMEREWLGIYDLVTHPEHRGKGYAEQLVLSLLQWGKHQGAKHSYLQVLKGNGPAIRLYDKLGYREIYAYWYRVKRGVSGSFTL